MPANDERNHDVIDIIARNTNSITMEFKMRKCQRLKVLTQAYSQRIGLPREGVRFEYNGDFIDDQSTPEELGMQNGDEILAFP